ncbi:hypothetical protein LshimejAT787_1901330 [Lyophyllum shimeji]|uniref:Uncharacterized protein n=1 Tax=Lyophyllum shimeji TaxID=47721 RepID=A0A9P3UUS7_LYOSH|nr:hypothetical protein LshimejAT787_1901330 [Lyophyllum shimeji]
MALPSLIGGLANREDFEPSAFYAMLSGILICIFLVKLIRRTSRTPLYGTCVFLFDRIISLSLRAAFAHRPPSAQSGSLIGYMQVFLAVESLALLIDCTKLLRCLLFNSTYPLTYPSEPLDVPPSPASYATLHWPTSATDRAPEVSLSFRRLSEDTVAPPSSIPEKEKETLVEPEDQPRHRFWFRRLCEAAVLRALAVFAIGIAGNTMSVAQRRDEQKTRINLAFRATSTSISLFLTLFVAGMTIWASRNLRRVNQKAAIPPSYRLAVMHMTTSAWDAQEPGAFNSSDAKGAFYALHILPEFLVAGCLCCINVREKFGTGLSGDSRWRDDALEENEKPEEKEVEKDKESSQTTLC